MQDFKERTDKKVVSCLIWCIKRISVLETQEDTLSSNAEIFATRGYFGFRKVVFFGIIITIIIYIG